MSVPAEIFRTYDIRGVVGRTLTPQIVRDIHQQCQPVRPREMLRKRLRPARLDRDAHALHRNQQRQQLRVGNTAVAPTLDDLTAQLLEQPPAEGRIHARIHLRRRGVRVATLEPRLVCCGVDQPEHLPDFVGSGRAWPPGPTRQHRARGGLENFAGDAARVPSIWMRGQSRRVCRSAPAPRLQRDRSYPLCRHPLECMGVRASILTLGIFLGFVSFIRERSNPRGSRSGRGSPCRER